MRYLWQMGPEMIHVLYEDNHLLCVEKPVNVPVQPDSSGDPSLLDMGKAYLKEKYQKPGNVFLGLVHRLDRPVGGVMVFARTSKAASRLSDSIRKNELDKWYLAVLDGTPKDQYGTLVDYLIKDHDSNTVTVTTPDQGKKSILHYEVLAEHHGHTLVRIKLETGRSHQIRVQFASRGMPLMYDQRYHPDAAKGQIALFAYHLSFPHPVTKQMITVEALPPHTDPWEEFEEVVSHVTATEEEKEEKTL
ncbi:MAG: RluA family pseudouridine synthase [Solobacterium sp.]|nr:RluA family pseudouridine synthase [Solobacterium sp.]MCH4222852.1 RluA family pseudouridine synthase [Solobacterium sp.]MCH4265437.1 RluA family pseudouridine synthase [Solobacterium sp.]